MKKTVIYVAILVVVSITAGVVLGLGISRRAQYARNPMFAHPPLFERGHDEGGGRTHILDMLTKRLKLNPQQVEKIRGILESSRAEAEGISRGIGEKLKAIKEDTDNKIRQVLTPEQQAEFKRLTAQFEGQLGGHRMPGGPEKGKRTGPGGAGENRECGPRGEGRPFPGDYDQRPLPPRD